MTGKFILLRKIGHFSWLLLQRKKGHLHFWLMSSLPNNASKWRPSKWQIVFFFFFFLSLEKQRTSFISLITILVEFCIALIECNQWYLCLYNNKPTIMNMHTLKFKITQSPENTYVLVNLSIVRVNLNLLF